MLSFPFFSVCLTFNKVHFRAWRPISLKFISVVVCKSVLISVCHSGGLCVCLLVCLCVCVCVCV